MMEQVAGMVEMMTMVPKSAPQDAKSVPAADVAGDASTDGILTVNGNGEHSSPPSSPRPEIPDDRDGRGHGGHSLPPKIGTLPLSVMVFYSVSGGPIGIEPAVRAGGFLPSLLGFLLAPLAWSVPEALVTAELGSAYPEASGGVAWIEEAFGPRAGFVAGYFTWASGATDNAIYPVLFLDYLLQMVGTGEGGDGGEEVSGGGGGMMGPMTRFLLLSSTSIILAIINYMGLEIVGSMSMVICLVSLSPFLILCVAGIPKVDPQRWFETTTGDEIEMDENGLGNEGWLPLPNLGGVLWRPFLNNLFWNLNSFDSAANFAGEVENPGTVFPRAMFFSLFLVVAAYFLPLLIAIGASESSRSDWTDGYLAKVCTDVIGPWLGDWTVFAAGISNIALFLSEMSSDAFQLMGMADRGLIPKVFATRSRFGTPTYGILLGTIFIIAMSVADFSALVEMLNFNYSVALLMEYAAFIKLRVSQSNVPRPYRIPLNTCGCILFVAPAVLMTLLVMALASYMTYIYFSAALICGLLIYRMQTCGKVSDDDEDLVEDVYLMEEIGPLT